MRLEKRKENRVILSVPVQFKVFQLDRLESDVQNLQLNLKAELKNLSSTGIQVVSVNRFQLGDVIELELEIPNKGQVRSVAKVIWCEEDSGVSQQEYRAGIQFIPVYDEDLEKLQEYLKSGNT